MAISVEEMNRARQLTRQGRLVEATRSIQQALRGAESAEGPSGNSADVVDVEFREIRAPGRAPGPALPIPRTRARDAGFEAHRFPSGGRTYAYRLFVPPGRDDRPLPVVVMLHGCTQDALDFAAGTGMNELAAQRGCIVVYPEQLARANRMRCWNWFDPAQHRREGGEPAMIAALATHVVQKWGGDARRVYVAGLSAGGAMAALVGQLYPEVFAGIGVHSGLPAG